MTEIAKSEGSALDPNIETIIQRVVEVTLAKVASAPRSQKVEMLDSAEVMALLRCGRTKLNELMRTGLLTRKKLGSKNLYLKTDVEALLGKY